MSVKRDNFTTVILSQKKKRKSVTLDIKIDVIERFKDGNRAVDIARDLGLQSSTVRTIRRNAEKITLSAQSVTPLSASRLSRNRSVIMEKMETLLNIWIEEQHEVNLSVSLKSIQEKALFLFDYLKQQLGESVINEKFSASRGWFERFKRRSTLYNTNVTDSSKPIDSLLNDATQLNNIISRIIEDGEYSPHQVFSVHKTCLFWKRLSSKINVSLNEPPIQFHKEHMNLLLGGNAAGDVKLKPLVVYHEDTPEEMKAFSKAHLPVLWQSSKSAQVNKSVLEEWFSGYFCPTIEDYCHTNKITQKVLLIIENVHDHPLNLDNLSKHVQVIFISTNTSTQEPSMGHSSIAAFKTLYINRLLGQSFEFANCVIKKEDANDFWHTYNIVHAIENIAEVWGEVKIHQLNPVWPSIWPELHGDSFHQLNQLFEESRPDEVDIASQHRSEVVEMKDVVGLLQKEGQTLCHQELVLIQQHGSNEEKDLYNTSNPSCSLSTKDLSQAFYHLSKAMTIFAEKDTERERSAQVNEDIKSAFYCYKKLYKQKTKNGP